MSFNCRSLAEMSEQRRFGAAVPGDGVGRRRGVCGGKEREETEAHLMVVLDGSGAAGRWVAGDVQGRRPWKLGSGELG